MRLGLKLVLIGGLLLVLMIPILMLRGLVEERQTRAEEVKQDIADSAARAQRVVGPLLIVDGERTLRREKVVTEGGVMHSVAETQRERVSLLVTPESLAIGNRLDTEQRRRGLFAATVYHDAMNLNTRFRLPPAPPLEGDLVGYRVLGARLVLGLADIRGIRRFEATVAGRPQRAEPGTGVAWLGEGVQVPLDVAALPAAGFDAVLTLDLAGTEALAWLPVAGENRVTLQADWPHPSFEGNYLPVGKTITARGFDAEWAVSRLSAQVQRQIARCGPGADACPGLEAGLFAVRLLDPVDRYLMTDRAMKYALLFLVLVFGAVFFIEVLAAQPVHPLQYGLTGLALGLFYLLLLSLAEHIGFAPAYALAAGACVGLISYYLSAVLGGRRRGLGFAAGLAGLYGLLYVLLQSEDYALLVGALALFALLALVMALTRRLDWYRLGAAPPRA